MPHDRADPPSNTDLYYILADAPSTIANIAVSWLLGEGAPAFLPQDPLASPPPFNSRYHRRLVIGLICFASTVAAILVVCCAITGFVWWRQRRSLRGNTMDGSSKVHYRPAAPNHDDLQRRALHRRLEELSPPQFANPRKFTFKELKRATQNFNKAEVLGEGGFGLVFRGKVPIDDESMNIHTHQVVAVKRIAKAKEGGLRGFQAELDNISILRHRNLVQLRGWGENKEWLFLVYEYMAKGSLDAFLHNEDKCEELNWTRRFGILKGVGSALNYLHVECMPRNTVLHRDIKSSNVLLDEDFNAKLGDFGLSRQVETVVSGYDATELAGTRGYMAPEYCYTRKATVQSDVFSFGAVLAEVASGMRALDKRLKDEGEGGNGLLLDWMWHLHSNGKLEDAIDKRLGQMYKREEMKRVLVVALACAHPDPKSRPTMKRALDYLEGIIPLPVLPLSKPHYSPMSPFDIAALQNDSPPPLTSSSGGLSTLRNALMRQLAPSSKPPLPPNRTSSPSRATGPSTTTPAAPHFTSHQHHPSSPSTPYISASCSPIVSPAAAYKIG